MKRRREHIECETRPGLGCVVLSTPTCPHRRSALVRWRNWLRATLTVELWWLFLMAIPSIICGVWLAWVLGSHQSHAGSIELPSRVFPGVET